MGLFHAPEAQGRDGDAAEADEEGRVHDAPVGLEAQETHGDGHHGPPDEVGHRHGDRGPHVRAELLAGDGHEHGPVARGKAQGHAEQVVCLGAQAMGEEGDQHHRQGEALEQEDGPDPAGDPLADEAGAQVADGQAQVAGGDGVAGIHRPHHAKALGEFRGGGHQDGHHVPDGDAHQDAAQVAHEPGAAGEEHQEIALGDLLLGQLLEHARIRDLDAQHQQSQSHHAASDEGPPPAQLVAHEIGHQGPGDAQARHHRGAVAAHLPGQHLAHQGDGRAQLAREPQARKEAQGGVGGNGRGEGVGDVGQGVQRDAAEEHGHAALLVAQDAPEDAAHQHAGHLVVEQVQEGRQGLGGRNAQVRQAPVADDGKEDEVKDVHEVPKPSNQHCKIENGREFRLIHKAP